MTALLPADERRKLVGILGRLASNHDGERAAAGLLATRMLTARGLSWDELVGFQVVRSEEKRTPAAPKTWRELAALCRRYRHVLTERESDFLESLTLWTGSLTPRQTAWLDRIAAKVRSEGSA